MIRALAIAALVWGWASGARAEGEGALPLVVIVKSQDLGPYTDAVTAFSLEARARLVEFDLRGDEERAKKAFAVIRERRPALVWALGPFAATYARRELGEAALVFSFVPNHEKYDLTGPLVTGISLTRTPRAQLETLHAVAPGARRVGVVFDPRVSTLTFETAQRAAQELGLLLVAARVTDESQVAAKAGELAGRIDALWMIADRTVATLGAFEQLLAFSQKQSLPIFALSEEQVKGGALVSLSPDVGAIGRQAARVANRIVHDGVPPRALPVVDPEGLELAINVSVARKLAVGCDLALDIFSFAAKRKYPIKVFE